MNRLEGERRITADVGMAFLLKASYRFSAVCILSSHSTIGVQGAELDRYRIALSQAIVGALFIFALCATAKAQTFAPPASVPIMHFRSMDSVGFDCQPADMSSDGSGSATSTNSGQGSRHGIIVRSVLRGLRDQKELYTEPFKPSNFKWDALFLAGTGALIATDRRTSRALPNGHVDLFRNITNVSLDSTSATLGGLWAYGIAKKNEHAKETGELELETLVNTFLIYTPMQFIAGRERPEEGTGNGRFWQHAGFNTSFPAGHPIFSWAMATVVAHEYPKPWVKLLAYGAATAVSMGRFLGREHYASDVLVGSVLGYAIASHIFHARCNPQRSEACSH